MNNQLITLTKEFKDAAYYITQQGYDLNPSITQRYTLLAWRKQRISELLVGWAYTDVLITAHGSIRPMRAKCNRDKSAFSSAPKSGVILPGGSRRLYGSMDAQGAVRGAPAADVDPPSGYPRHPALKRGHDAHATVVPGLPA